MIVLLKDLDPDIFDTTLTDEAYYLKGILSGRFVLSENNTVVYDTLRDHYFKSIYERKNKVISLVDRDWVQYHITSQENHKRTVRYVLLHRFVYMYYHKVLIPKYAKIVVRDGDKWNLDIDNLMLVAPHIEEKDFTNENISNSEWFYNQILSGRFLLLDNDTILYDRNRNLYTKLYLPPNTLNGYRNYNLGTELVVGSKKYIRGIRLHTLVWMIANKSLVPEHYDLHHIDRNRLNNLPKNLQLLSDDEHAKIHYDEDNKQPRLNSLDANKRGVQNRIIYHALKNKYMYYEKKVCARCKRLLPHDQFHKQVSAHTLLKLKWCCKECDSLRRMKDIINYFPNGILNDKIIVDIRFRFFIMNHSFTKILLKYKKVHLTKETLHDILAGIAYTHIDTLHGIKSPLYKVKYINELEHYGIQKAYEQGGFTKEELCEMFGRSDEEITYVFTMLQYNPGIEMVNNTLQYIQCFI